MRSPDGAVDTDDLPEVVTPVCVALVSTPDAESAEALGRTVVGEGLAACANVVPGVTSVYRWQGEVRCEAESLVILKTTDARAGDLARRVVELHPYDVPEVVVMEVQGGHEPYLEWVRRETASGPGGRS